MKLYSFSRPLCISIGLEWSRAARMLIAHVDGGATQWRIKFRRGPEARMCWGLPLLHAGPWIAEIRFFFPARDPAAPPQWPPL